MNVLLVNRMMGIAWGGGENYDYNLARGLEALGHRVLIVTGHRWGERGRAETGGIETISIGTPYLRQYMYRWAGRLALLPGLMSELDLELFRAAVLPRVSEIVRGRGVDVVQVLSLPRLASSLVARGIPTVMRFPGPPAWFLANRLKRLSQAPRMAMFSHGDTVGLVERRWNLTIEEVPPGVDGELYRPANSVSERSGIRREIGIPETGGLLISVGRLVPGKGHEPLLKGFRQLVRHRPGVKLLLVGDGPLRARLEAAAARLGIANDVIFAGARPRDEVARLLRAADLFCLLSGYENYSNAVLEAMSTGLPVIASRVGGFPMQVRDGVNGFLVGVDDDAGFVARAAAVLKDSALSAELSRGARRFAGGFSWRASAGRAQRIYEEVVTA